jgi:hypothetical protein
MRQYVTSILVAVSRNTAIALAFAFGPAETVDQYNLIFTAFSRYGIDLSTFILESDQGSSLTLFAKTHNIAQQFCLHHFLHIVCKGTFCWGIANAVRARIITERDRLPSELTLLIRQFYAMLTDQNVVMLGKDLKKAGFGLQNGTVCIVDQRRWEQVAMSARVDDGIPPTTGCLESIHGNHNKSTPRHNTFWASMYRLATQIVRSVEG